jgi:hypothetical protein
VNELEQLFPRLVGNQYQITSPRDRQYNCIAWAVGDTQRWWWPGENKKEEYWPLGVKRERSREAFVAAFVSLGYAACDSEVFEAGYQKIALFENDEGPTHAARQLPNGRWSSKLGKMEDIEHALHDLEGTVYGSVVLFMKRKTPSMV